MQLRQRITFDTNDSLLSNLVIYKMLIVILFCS